MASAADTEDYLALHLGHLSGELDLRGVGELGVERGRGSFDQHLRPIVHLRRYRDKDGNISTSWLEMTPFPRNPCHLALQLRHLQSVLYLRRVGELGVEGDRGLSLPVFLVLFLRSDQTGSIKAGC